MLFFIFWLTLFLFLAVGSYYLIYRYQSFKNKGLRLITTTVYVLFILFSVFVLSRNFLFEPFAIPSASMENTIYPGDIMIADKFRLDPLKLEKGKIYVFRNENGGYFIKRCIATAGDEVRMQEGKVFINNLESLPSPLTKHEYQIKLSKVRGFFAFIEEQKIGELFKKDPKDSTLILASLSLPDKEKVEKFHNIVYIRMNNKPSNAGLIDSNAFVNPVRIPNKGMEIQMDSAMFSKYKTTLLNGEGVTITEHQGAYLLNGKPIKKYRFMHDYVFVLGDNRENSIDSRAAGFIRANQALGKTTFVLCSFNDGAFNWNRFFTRI